MNRIRTILFDLGGVIITIDQEQAIERFSALGLRDARQQLNPYTQTGIFGDVEAGKITDEEFRQAISLMARREVSWQECCHAWQGYCGGLPQRNLDKLRDLRQRGYRVVLVSNTNPFMMSWAMSPEFDGHGHPLSHYMDSMYMSYKIGAMKPDPRFFEAVIKGEGLNPAECLFLDDGQRNVGTARSMGFNTMCPKNGEDWTQDLERLLSEDL